MRKHPSGSLICGEVQVTNVAQWQSISVFFLLHLLSKVRQLFYAGFFFHKIGGYFLGEQIKCSPFFMMKFPMLAMGQICKICLTPVRFWFSSLWSIGRQGADSWLSLRRWRVRSPYVPRKIVRSAGLVAKKNWDICLMHSTPNCYFLFSAKWLCLVSASGLSAGVLYKRLLGANTFFKISSWKRARPIYPASRWIYNSYRSRWRLESLLFFWCSL